MTRSPYYGVHSRVITKLQRLAGFDAIIFAGMGGSPDVHGFGIFWMHRDAVAAAWDMRSAFNQVSVRLSPGANEGEVIDALNGLIARAFHVYGGVPFDFSALWASPGYQATVSIVWAAAALADCQRVNTSNSSQPIR